MKCILSIILIIAFCVPAYGDDTDGKANLKKGKKELDCGKYEGAISSLSSAVKDFSLLGDYALLWLSDAYHETGNHKDSLKAIRTLLKKYSDSPLAKKARIREIKEAEEVSEDNIQELFEDCIKDYPKDEEMKFLYAKWLRQNDKTEKSGRIFKEIYISAGSFSDMAYNELVPSDLGAADLLERAANLMKRMEYKDAESSLKSAMKKDNGRFKNEILKNLGLCLFKQKKYMEAAEIYKQTRDRYWELRSLYRAGEKERVNEALDELLEMRDKAGSVLIAIASDKRREGKIEEALRIYQDVSEHFPAESEEALWGVGWTYYRTGEYKKASDIFKKLYGKYGDSKYLYWNARSLEAEGGDAQKTYNAVMEIERDFYSIMSYARNRTSLSQSDTGGTPEKFRGVTPVKGYPRSSKRLERVEALIDLGFSKEALMELAYASKNISSIEDILYFCSKFYELGEYRRSISLAAKLPYKENIHSFLYPLAYRDSIENLSGKYAVDPHLVLSVTREESRFDPEAKSPAGALGLMQLMPGTAFKADSKLKLGIKNPHDVLKTRNNLHVGIFYLSRLVKEFGSYPYAIAAYNAGEEIVKKWLRNGKYKSADEFIEDIPYSETRNYVKKVITTFFEYERFSTTGDKLIEIPLGKL